MPKFDLFLKNKNIILLFILLVFIVLIIFLSYLILKPTASKKDLINFLEKNSQQSIPKFRITNAIDGLKNDKLKPEVQYENLTILAYSAQDNYFRSNSPEAREYLTKLNEKVKNCFPNLHQDQDFLVGCADPECGDKPDQEELRLLEDIQNFKVDELFKDVVSINLRMSIYIPYDNRSNKIQKFNKFIIVHQQLLELNNSEASKSAKAYADYIKKKYNYDVNKPNILPPDL